MDNSKARQKAKQNGMPVHTNHLAYDAIIDEIKNTNMALLAYNIQQASITVDKIIDMAPNQKAMISMNDKRIIGYQFQQMCIKMNFLRPFLSQPPGRKPKNYSDENDSPSDPNSKEDKKSDDEEQKEDSESELSKQGHAYKLTDWFPCFRSTSTYETQSQQDTDPIDIESSVHKPPYPSVESKEIESEITQQKGSASKRQTKAERISQAEVETDIDLPSIFHISDLSPTMSQIDGGADTPTRIKKEQVFEQFELFREAQAHEQASQELDAQEKDHSNLN